MKLRKFLRSGVLFAFALCMAAPSIKVYAEEDVPTDVEMEITDEVATDVESDLSATGATSTQTIGTVTPDGNFLINGVTYVLSERFSDEEIPEGYSRTELSFTAGTYTELSNGTFVLVYLKPEDNTNGDGEFYLYDQATESVALFRTLGSEDNYIILTSPDSMPSSLFTASTLQIGEEAYDAYIYDGNTASGFYYVFGVGMDGQGLWYSYDTYDGSVQRANTTLFVEEETVDTTVSEETDTESTDQKSTLQKKLSKYRIAICVVSFLAVVFFILFINAFISNRRIREEGDIWDDDDADYDESRYDDDEYDDEEYSDEEYEDEEDEQEYDEESVEAPVAPVRTRKTSLSQEDEIADRITAALNLGINFDAEEDSTEDSSDDDDDEFSENSDEDRNFEETEFIDLNNL